MFDGTTFERKIENFTGTPLFSSLTNKQASENMSMSFNMTKSFETALTGVVGDAVEKLSKKYGFDRAEAMEFLGVVAVVSKKQTAKAKTASKSDKCPIILPYCGVVVDEWCKGVKPHHGTYSQCQNAPSGATDYCGTCGKHAAKAANGKPKNGDIRDREGMEVNGKTVKSYMTVWDKMCAKKEDMTLEFVQEMVHKFMGEDVEIPEEQKVVSKKAKAGRPKKNKTDDDDASDIFENDEASVVESTATAEEEEEEIKEFYTQKEMKVLVKEKKAIAKKKVPTMMKNGSNVDVDVNAKDLRYIGTIVFLKNDSSEWEKIGEMDGKVIMLKGDDDDDDVEIEYGSDLESDDEVDE